MFKKLTLAAAWFCVALIIVLSLIPLNPNQRTGEGGVFEHIIAYAITAGLFALRDRDKMYFVIMAVGLCALSGMLELLQTLTPTRHAGWAGLFSSAAGSVAGTLLGAVVYRLFLVVKGHKRVL